MKIDRLYTLSQFVDELAETKPLRINDLFYKVCKYNDFLKQRLKKEMFVNEVDKPTNYNHWDISAEYIKEEMAIHSQCLAWKEADNQVIFKGWEIIYQGNHVINLKHGDKRICFSKTITYFKVDKEGRIIDETEEVIKFLEDLVRLTNGELRLKNVDI